MLMNAIMAISMYPVVLILYFVYRAMGLNHSKYVFGINLPGKWKNSEELQVITQGYKKQMRWIFWIAVITPLPAFLTSYVSIQFTIWMTWFLVLIALLMVPYMIANKKVMIYKNRMENLYGIEKMVNQEGDHIEYIELRDVRTVHIGDFILQIIASIVPVIVLFTAGHFMELDVYQDSRLDIYRYALATFALGTILIVIIAFWMDRMRMMVINGNSDINTNYARAKKMVWKRIWWLMSIVNTVIIVAVAVASLVDFYTFVIFMAGTILETVLGVVITWKAAVELRQISEAYEKHFVIPSAQDDDRNWKWGLFYYNKADKKTMVEQRFGIGSTYNMAKKGGKVIVIIVILALIWVPIMCGYMIFEEFTPMHLLINDGAVVCEHMKVEYTIDMDSVEEVQLLNELPRRRSKNFGTASDRMEKGSFSIHDYGKVKEFLNPENDLFIYIKTADTQYMLSGYTDEETKEIYESIVQ